MQAEVIFNQKAVDGLIENSIDRRLDKIAAASVLESQRRFRLPKSGKFYSRGKAQGGGRAFRGGGRYRASAKGEAPAIRSGRLFNSIKIVRPNKTSRLLIYDTPYAAYLEPPAPLDRPFALVSVETVVERFNQSLRF